MDRLRKCYFHLVGGSYLAGDGKGLACETYDSGLLSSVCGLINHIVHFWSHYTVHCTEKVVSVHRFCVSRKSGTGGGGWDHPQGDMHIVAARLGCQNAMVGSGRLLGL